MAEALKKRSEMDPQFQWDLRDLIPTEKALEELFSELESGIGRYEGFKGRLGEDAAVLKEYLDHDVAMDLKFSRLLAYAIQKRDEDPLQIQPVPGKRSAFQETLHDRFRYPKELRLCKGGCLHGPG